MLHVSHGAAGQYVDEEDGKECRQQLKPNNFFRDRGVKNGILLCPKHHNYTPFRTPERTWVVEQSVSFARLHMLAVPVQLVTSWLA